MVGAAKPLSNGGRRSQFRRREARPKNASHRARDLQLVSPALRFRRRISPPENSALVCASRSTGGVDQADTRSPPAPIMRTALDEAICGQSRCGGMVRRRLPLPMRFAFSTSRGTPVGATWRRRSGGAVAAHEETFINRGCEDGCRQYGQMGQWRGRDVLCPQQATTAAFADSKHDEQTPAAQSQLRADLPPLPASGGYDPIMVVGAAFALIATAALVCFLVWMRPLPLPLPLPLPPPLGRQQRRNPLLRLRPLTVKPILGQAPSDAGLEPGPSRDEVFGSTTPEK